MAESSLSRDDWQSDGEIRALARHAFDFDVAAVSSQDGVAGGESEPRSPLAFGGKERAERFFLDFEADAGARIADLHDVMLVRGVRACGNLSFAFDGIHGVA